MIKRLKWFEKHIGQSVKRKEIFSYDIVEIYVQDTRKACLLYDTQFDIGLRYFVA